MEVGIKYSIKGTSHNPAGDGRTFDYYDVFLVIEGQNLRIGEWGIPEGKDPMAYFSDQQPFWQGVVDNIEKRIRLCQ